MTIVFSEEFISVTLSLLLFIECSRAIIAIMLWWQRRRFSEVQKALRRRIEEMEKEKRLVQDLH